MRYSRDFTVTRQDTLMFYQMLALRRWCKGIIGFSVVGALVAKLYLNWLDFAMDGFETGLFMVFSGVLTALLIALGTVIRTRIHVNSLMRKKGRESYVQQLRIDGFGFHVAVGQESARLKFEDILRVEEKRDVFYLFLTENDAWILPKREMEDSEAESRALRDIFTRVIAPKRLKLQK